jgi:membrane-associated protease RseP (regulator of RpoE activity)
MMALGVLAFVVALLTSVMLHEAGHFLTARAFGMKATQFFVGFGPTLWSRRKGETEYGVKAIPAGGFVKIIGMTPLEDVAAEDKPRAFISKGGWQRFVVLVAGSTVHFLIALLLFFVFSVAWPARDTGYATINQVYPCAVPDDQGNCAPGATPAPGAGVLQKGDVITAVNGRDVASTESVLRDPGKNDDGDVVKGGPDGLVALVRNTSGPVTLTILRDGKTRQVHVTPVVSNGQPRIGFLPGPDHSRYGVVGAAANSVSLFGQTTVGSFKALGAVPHEIGRILSGDQGKRTADSGGGAQVTSVVGVAQISGEAFQAGGFSGGVATLVLITASVNLFVGIFNLFPFLPLDGGHVAILAYEKARDRIRRRRKLPAAGPVDLTKLMPVTYGALALIVGMSMIVLYADVVNPVANPFQ